jgi:hypothetical protein
MHFQYDGTWMICLYCGGELGWSCDCFDRWLSFGREMHAASRLPEHRSELGTSVT